MKDLSLLFGLFFVILTICALGICKIKSTKRGVLAKVLLGFVALLLLLGLGWFIYVLCVWGPRVQKM